MICLAYHPMVVYICAEFHDEKQKNTGKQTGGFRRQ